MSIRFGKDKREKQLPCWADT